MHTSNISLCVHELVFISVYSMLVLFLVEWQLLDFRATQHFSLMLNNSELLHKRKKKNEHTIVGHLGNNELD